MIGTMRRDKLICNFFDKLESTFRIVKVIVPMTLLQLQPNEGPKYTKENKTVMLYEIQNVHNTHVPKRFHHPGSELVTSCNIHTSNK